MYGFLTLLKNKNKKCILLQKNVYIYEVMYFSFFSFGIFFGIWSDVLFFMNKKYVVETEERFHEEKDHFAWQRIHMNSQVEMGVEYFLINLINYIAI